MKTFSLLIIVICTVTVIGCGPGNTPVKGTVPVSTVDDTIVLSDYSDNVVNNHYAPSVPEQMPAYIPTIQQQAQIQHRRVVYRQMNPPTVFMNAATTPRIYRNATPTHLQLRGGVHVIEQEQNHH